MKKRPDFIVSWQEIEAPAGPPQSPEDFGFASEFAAATGLNHLRVAHLRLPPGRRGYPPIAMEDHEIFAFVLDGTPDLWVDGYLHRLVEGDGVALNARTGIAHTLINNSDGDVRLFVLTEVFRRNTLAVHPRDDAANANLARAGMLWADAPRRRLGPNDGVIGNVVGRKRARPAYVHHWRDLLEKKAGRYPDSTEDHGIDIPFGNRARYSRIGIHAEYLKSGRRSSYPHAERDEEEFVYVVSGAVDCWIDGHIHPMRDGDFVGWRSQTGIAHTIINNSDEDALILTGGEASRERNQIRYPFHPSRNKARGEQFWTDHPVRNFGPHDGLPDALRARLPKRALRSPVIANETARFPKNRK